MDAALQGEPREYQIKRSVHLGYGFIAGFEQPTMVKIIEPKGPSYGRLLPGDVIMAVNGIDVEKARREQVVKMIQECESEIFLKVRQPSYEELLRAKNLADPKFYMFNNSPNQQSANLVPSYNHQGHLPKVQSSLQTNHSPLNRLVTSISEQKPPPLSNNIGNQDVQQVQAKYGSKEVLKQRKDENGFSYDRDGNNNLFKGTATLERNRSIKYGSHSPLPQRCKSSLDITKPSKSGSKKVEDEHNQPLLKRSNTMRPIRTSAKVKEILEVVTRIFFEDGHTRVLTYNQHTTVGAILETLNTRSISNPANSEQIRRYFGLTLTLDPKETSKEQQISKRKLLHILDENDSIMKISQLPYATKLRLLYRMIYPPPDVNKLYLQDKLAFEYLYKQSCNDLRADRFCPEIDYDTVMKLSALHLVEYVYSNLPKAHGNSKDPKVYIRLIKKTPGIEYFLPAPIIQGTKDKKGKRIVGQYKKTKNKLSEQIRKNFEEFDFEPASVKSTTNLNRYTSTSFHELSLPESPSSQSDNVKLVFLNYLSQLPCYGNSKRPKRSSTSPIERSSAGECSTSLESVPRTSDSSPLLRQDRNPTVPVNNCRSEHSNLNNMSRIAQANSMRSPGHSLYSSSNMSQVVDQPDAAQTPSIESISSITFNMQSSPSPQQTLPQQIESYQVNSRPSMLEPSPMPRHQIPQAIRQQEISSKGVFIEPCYRKSLDELVRNATILPPPPVLTSISNDTLYRMRNSMIYSKYASHLTPILTDQDLEPLKVPPPPRIAL